MLSSRPWQALRASPNQFQARLLVPTNVSQSRCASLSAIHRGRATEHRRGGRSRSAEQAPVPMNRTERSRARAAAEDQTFKIKKGKKDITEKAVPDALTRQARFYNPNFSHGKKSLVYQMKTGQLREKLKTLQNGEAESRPWSKSSTVTKSAFDDAFKGQSPFGRGTNGAKLEPRRAPADRDSDRPKPRITGNWADRGTEGYRPSRETRRIDMREDDSRGADRRERGGVGAGRERRPTERSTAFTNRGGAFTNREGGSRERRPTERSPGFGDREGGSRPRADFANREGASRERRPTDRSPAFTTREGAFTHRDGGSRERRPAERSPAFGDRQGGSRPNREWDSRPSTDFKEIRRSRETRDPERENRRWSKEEHKEFHRTKELPGSRDSGRNTSPQHEPERPMSIEYTTAASQFLYGKSVVEAALKTSSRKLYKLYVYAGENRENVEVDEVMVKLARKQGIPVRNVQERDARLMDKMSGGRPHNGYILEASPLPQMPLTGLGPFEESEGRSGFKIELAHQSAEDAAVNGTNDFIRTVPSSHKPLVVVLDQILDPQNLGAILRSINFLGATAVVITKRNSATLTPVALKASAGASEALTLFSVDNLAPFLDNSKENGWKVYTAVPPASSAGKHRQMSVYEVEEQDPLSKDPCILLLGGEGEGLSKQLKAKADVELNIRNMSQTNLVDSLNVSVAAGLLTASLVRGKAMAEVQESEKKREKLSLF